MEFLLKGMQYGIVAISAVGTFLVGFVVILGVVGLVAKVFEMIIGKAEDE